MEMGTEVMGRREKKRRKVGSRFSVIPNSFRNLEGCKRKDPETSSG